MMATRYTLAIPQETVLLTDFRLMLLHEVRGRAEDGTTATLRQGIEAYFPEAIRSGKYMGWMAWAGDVLVGTCGMVVREQPPSYKYTDGRIAYVMNMYVLPQYRGQGIGKMLFAKIMESTAAAGIQKVELHATADGEPLYRKFGFKEPASVVLEVTKEKPA